MQFKRGEVYRTPYGRAVVDSTQGRLFARMRITTISMEASKLGWHNGMTFQTHADDQTVPPPSEWEKETGS